MRPPKRWYLWPAAASELGLLPGDTVTEPPPPPPPERRLGYRGTLPIVGGRVRGIPIIIVARGRAASHLGPTLEVEMKISVERRRDDFIPIEVKPPALEVFDQVESWDLNDPRMLTINRTSTGPDEPNKVLIPIDLIRTIRVLP